jgi:hypothetical protein
MSDIPFELISNIAKRAWKFSYFFLFYFCFALFLFFSIFIYKKLYLISNLENISVVLFKILYFLISSAFVSIIIYFLIWVLKGESDFTIKKLRKNFYDKAVKRVEEVMKYRFELEDYNEDIKILTMYNNKFEKNGRIHIVKVSNLKSYIVNGVDTLYFFYKINNEEKIIWSIWHSGDFLAIALAIDEDLVSNSNYEEILLKSFNLTSAKDYDLGKRDKYIWFDVKFDVSEEFLVNNIEKEKISRWIAHFVSIGVISGLKILNWKQLKE